MINETHIRPTAVPTGFSIPLCRENRARCLQQARKRKDMGDRLAVVTWLGYALYWHTRVTHAGKTADECQDIAHARGARWNVRSTAQQQVTAAAAAAGMNVKPSKADTATPFNGDFSLSAFHAGLGVVS